MDTLDLVNCRLWDAEPDAPAVCIRIAGGLITHVGPALRPDGAGLVDVEGHRVAPGLIDVHIQGAGGADVLDATPEAIRQMARTVARFGVTSFLATTVCQPGRANDPIRVAAECVGQDLGGAQLLGIHLEGPFISPDKRGMIQPEGLCEPRLDVLEDILSVSRGRLRMMTVAPELPGALEIVERLVEKGIIASFGHSNATYEQTLCGSKAGISHVTHLFNAMAPMHHREPGPLPAIWQSPQVTCQLIADGVHVHPAMVAMAFALLGPQRITLITDGMQALGLPDGSYRYNGVEYEAKDGTARYKDGTLIGTAIGLSRLVARFREMTDCSPATAVDLASANPARILGLERRKGRIVPGMDADLIVLDNNGSVRMTIVGGKVVFDGIPPGEA